MNIENFTPFPVTISEIFMYQKALKFQYEPEAKEIFENFDLDCHEDQEVFKKYCWRITEELGEALEAAYNREKDHVLEEFIDAFNFTIELFLLIGWEPYKQLEPQGVVALKDKSVHVGRTAECMQEIVYDLTMCANLLKNRQWRQSQYLVDMHVFEKRMQTLWRTIFIAAGDLGLTEKDLYDLWTLKYQVNKFRIETKY